MNPLVTIVNLAVGKIGWLRCLVYISAQMIGAITGFGLLHVSTSQKYSEIRNVIIEARLEPFATPN